MNGTSKSTLSQTGFASYLATGYWNVFGREWPPWLGGLILGLLNWGSWIIKSVGIKPVSDPIAPWFNTGSVQDFGIFFGAFIAILMASNFRFRMPQRKIRLVEGFAGGVLMGIGAMFAPG